MAIVLAVLSTASVASTASADEGDGGATPSPRHSGVAADTPIGPISGSGTGGTADGESGAGGSARTGTGGAAGDGGTASDVTGTGTGTGGTAADGTPGPGTAADPGAGATGAPSAPTASAIPGWLHTDGGTIETADGAPYVIKAIAWFGLESSNCAPHGLWSISLDAGLAQLASMGFTTIRLPYSNECLGAASTNSISAYANPTLVGLTPLQLMDTVIQTAKSYGLTVILDRHRPDSGAQSELWYTAAYPEQAWIADWQMLAQRYAAEPAVIGVDLHNEPHGSACWACGDPALDWHAAAERAGDAVLAVNPNLLVVVEGVEQQGDGSSTWWGGGLADAGANPVELAVADRVVYSPHDYPASIYAQPWFGASDYPANLPGVWEANWGYLATQGIAPVLLGEFGTRLETASDAAWLTTLVDYLAATGMSFSYWSFNPNSGDTGGIVADDWVTPQSAKLQALAPLIGAGSTVAPHSAVPAPVPDAGAAIPDDAGSPTPSAPASASPAPTRPRGPISGTVRPGPPGPAGGAPSPAAPVSPPTTPDGLPRLAAQWTLQSEWESGYVAEVTVSNTGSSSGWTVSWPDTGATAISNAWGMECGVAAATVTCTGSQWGAFVSPGQTVTAGVQVVSTAAPRTPTLALTSR